MKIKYLFIFILILVSLITIYITSTFPKNDTNNILSYTVNPSLQNLQFYWKDDNGNIFRTISNLKIWLKHKNKKLIFAMNGGMFNKDNAPHGLYIENGVTITPIDTLSGDGNFYLKPNGIFYITNDNKPFIYTTEEYRNITDVKYATQSGPMLVIDGKINPKLIKGSNNKNIRNGVGILTDGKILFAMSKVEINFYDFATYFKNLGCKNALYFDGFVSRTYLPEKKLIQTDGNFGVIIGVAE